MNTYIDLHMHSIYSDGTQTPTELCSEAAQRGIKLIALTDHDSIDGITEMLTAAKQKSIACIAGVEISVMHAGREIHLLTYGVDKATPQLSSILRHNQDIREAHNNAIIQYLASKHPNVSFNDYINYQRDPRLGGWKAVNYLMDFGIIESVGDFFEIVEDYGTPLTFEPIELILPQLVKESYTVVLAHPPAYALGNPLPKELLDQWVKMGLAGIECFSPYYKANVDNQNYIDYCTEKNLIMTCGSDYHGCFIPSRKMGIPSVTSHLVSYDQLMKLT